MIPAPSSSTVRLKRRILSLKGLLSGLAAGFVAIAFRLCLEQSERLRDVIVSFSESRALYFLPALIFCICITIGLFLLFSIAPEASGSGIPHLKGCLKGFHPFRASRILFVKFIGGILCIGSGLALGREGPTIQMGGAVGKIMGDNLCTDEIEKRILIAASAGAGLSAAFNAPLAGIFFVVEELENNFNPLGLVTAFAACVSSDMVCRLVMGQLPVFHVDIAYYPEIRLFPLFIALGAVLGLTGYGFNRFLIASLNLIQRLKIPRMGLGLLVGIISGVIVFIDPKIPGSGTTLIETVLTVKVGLASLGCFFIIRFLFTTFSYCTGAPGGIFAPLLLLGALAGVFFGNITLILFPAFSLSLTAWGVLGMAGLFSAIVRAPITGIILILEMTNQHFLLLPLIIVSIVAYSIPEYFKEPPIYEALLNRDLRSGTPRNPL